jgi:uncharacterized protein (DUF302 family)
MTKYGFGKTVDLSFDDAIVHVTQALQVEGFGILADIDVAGAMKNAFRSTRLRRFNLSRERALRD